MKKIIHEFYSSKNDPLTTFRTIMLFGKNVSTYKFALSYSLLNQLPKSEIKLDDLTFDFIKELYRHYSLNSSQWTGGANSITKEFDEYRLTGNFQNLVENTQSSIYKYVLDAFHNIGGSNVKDEYMLFEKSRKGKNLVLTDNLNHILSNEDFKNLIKKENEGRWQIVEEAWKNNLSPNLLEYNKTDNNIYSFNIHNTNERINLRSAVNVLLPYQKGNCFYCNKKINPLALNHESDFPDVDHFWPFAFLAKYNISPLSVNGIWNLVISCRDCNRGSLGKFDSPPDKEYFQKLLSRNLLFAEEHRHSLKNSILISLNAKNSQDINIRMTNLNNLFSLINGWKPKEIYNT